jgi:hypothetical protein
MYNQICYVLRESIQKVCCVFGRKADGLEWTMQGAEKHVERRDVLPVSGAVEVIDEVWNRRDYHRTIDGGGIRACRD